MQVERRTKIFQFAKIIGTVTDLSLNNPPEQKSSDKVKEEAKKNDKKKLTVV